MTTIDHGEGHNQKCSTIEARNVEGGPPTQVRIERGSRSGENADDPKQKQNRGFGDGGGVVEPSSPSALVFSRLEERTRVLEFRARATKVPSSVMDAVEDLRSICKNKEVGSIIDLLYELTHKKDHGEKTWDVKAKFSFSYGLVAGLLQDSDSLSQAVLFKHVNIPEHLMLRMNDSRKKDDIFELLGIFCDLSQVLEDSKVHDLVWLVVNARFITLAPYITTVEPLTRWPAMLRNAKSHSQVLLAASGMITAYNNTSDKNRLKRSNGEEEEPSNSGARTTTWSLSIEVRELIIFLRALFGDVFKAGKDLEDPFKPARSDCKGESCQRTVHTREMEHIRWCSRCSERWALIKNLKMKHKKHEAEAPSSD